MNAIAILSHHMDKHGVLGEQTLARIHTAVQLAREQDCRLLLASGWAYRDDSMLKIGTCVHDYINQNFELTDCTVLSDTNSRDTVGDAFYLRKRLREYPIKKLFVVTSDYHVPRSKLIFDAFFAPGVIVDTQGARLDSDSNMGLAAHEKASIDAFHSTFKGVDLSDDNQVTIALNSLHPFYNGDVYPNIA